MTQEEVTVRLVVNKVVVGACPFLFYLPLQVRLRARTEVGGGGTNAPRRARRACLTAFAGLLDPSRAPGVGPCRAFARGSPARGDIDREKHPPISRLATAAGAGAGR